MKEVNIEEKAKRYDEAIERARALNNAKDTCEYIFPELKESEDDRIRKNLITCISTLKHPLFSERERKEFIAWLEKQGEQKLVDKIQIGKKYKCIASPRYSTFMTGEIYKPEDKFLCSLMNFCSDCFEPIEDGEVKPTKKVEPKFKNGEWIVWQNRCYKVKYNGCGYELVDQNGLSTSLEYGTIDENAHLWDITKDAKPGDFLDANGAPFIYKKHDKDYVYFYSGVNLTGEFIEANGIDTWNDNNKVYPATKEQCDLLFKKMKEALYERIISSRKMN